jgi:hypothetical protein
MPDAGVHRSATPAARRTSTGVTDRPSSLPPRNFPPRSEDDTRGDARRDDGPEIGRDVPQEGRLAADREPQERDERESPAAIGGHRDPSKLEVDAAAERHRIRRQPPTVRHRIEPAGLHGRVGERMGAHLPDAEGLNGHAAEFRRVLAAHRAIESDDPSIANGAEVSNVLRLDAVIVRRVGRSDLG